jgi:hypothetical protein
MNTSGTRSSGNESSIHDKISNLSVEIVLVGVPVVSSVRIRIGIDHGHSRESWSCKNSWKLECVSNELSEIILNDWGANQVSSSREEHESGLDCGRITSLSTSSISSDGCIDCCSIVGLSISFGSKIFDVSVYLVSLRIVVESGYSIVSDSSHPKRRWIGFLHSWAEILLSVVVTASIDEGIVTLRVTAVIARLSSARIESRCRRNWNWIYDDRCSTCRRWNLSSGRSGRGRSSLRSRFGSGRSGRRAGRSR